MKKEKVKKVYREYKIMLEEEQATEMLDFAKKYDMKVTGLFRRGIRLLIESENLKNQIIEGYHNGHKMSIIG